MIEGANGRYKLWPRLWTNILVYKLMKITLLCTFRCCLNLCNCDNVYICIANGLYHRRCPKHDSCYARTCPKTESPQKEEPTIQGQMVQFIAQSLMVAGSEEQCFALEQSTDGLDHLDLIVAVVYEWSIDKKSPDSQWWSLTIRGLSATWCCKWMLTTPPIHEQSINDPWSGCKQSLTVLAALWQSVHYCHYPQVSSGWQGSVEAGCRTIAHIPI